MEENVKETTQENLTNEQIAEAMADRLAKARLENESVQVLDQVNNLNAPLAKPVNAHAELLDEDLPTPGELAEVVEISKRILTDKKFKAFNALPKVFKDRVRKEAIDAGVDISNKTNLEVYTRMAIEQLVNESKLDTAFDELTKGINEAFEFRDSIEGLLDEDHNRFDVKLREIANTLKEKKDEANYNKIMGAIHAYIDAYDYSKYVELVSNDEVLANRLKNGGKYLKRANRFFEDYIYNITSKNAGIKIGESMQNIVSRFSYAFKIDFDSAARFMIIMSILADKRDMTDDLDSNKVFYRYYSLDIIRKISRIAMKESEVESEFCLKLISNIKNTINQLDEIVNKSLEV